MVKLPDNYAEPFKQARKMMCWKAKRNGMIDLEDAIKCLNLALMKFDQMYDEQKKKTEQA